MRSIYTFNGDLKCASSLRGVTSSLKQCLVFLLPCSIAALASQAHSADGFSVQNGRAKPYLVFPGPPCAAKPHILRYTTGLCSMSQSIPFQPRWFASRHPSPASFLLRQNSVLVGRSLLRWSGFSSRLCASTMHSEATRQRHLLR